MPALSTSLRRVALMPLLVVTSLLAAGSAGAMGLGISEYACGPIAPPGQFGPFDYRTVPSETRHKVEDYHFPPKVEQGIEGMNGSVGSDVDYTLRAFPNNPRALLTISRFSMKLHTEHAPGARYSTECYFERAIRYQPDDPMVRIIYAIYLKDRKRTAEAKTQLDQAEQLRGSPSNFDLDYNLGLLYCDIGAYDQAMTAARRAYALGAPLPALQRKLQAAGKWKNDPPAAPADAATDADPKAKPETNGDTKADAVQPPAPAR